MGEEITTVCAISTAPGQGAVALVRLTGERAVEIADSVWSGKSLAGIQSRKTTLGYIIGSDGERIDQVLATVYRAPASFTGEDMVEISCHGSLYVQQAMLNTLIEAGARAAEPGEFSRRAVMNGRMDLTQAEAVADMIASTSRAGAQLALKQMDGAVSRRLEELRKRLTDLTCLVELQLDFSEEDLEFASQSQILTLARELECEIAHLLSTFRDGNAIKEGVAVAIAGATNAGKSSLLNALTGRDRAIVSEIDGTTRDTVEDCVDIGGFRFRFIDTAGLRATADPIERLGIERSVAAISRARIVLHVIDSTRPIQPDTTLAHALSEAKSSGTTILEVLNKTDLIEATQSPKDIQGNSIRISARTGEGMDDLKQLMLEKIKAGNDPQRDTIITNARHADALGRALQSIRRLSEDIEAGRAGDQIAADLREIESHLGEITGELTTPALLETIFSRFCIGK